MNQQLLMIIIILIMFANCMFCGVLKNYRITEYDELKLSFSPKLTDDDDEINTKNINDTGYGDEIHRLGEEGVATIDMEDQIHFDNNNNNDTEYIDENDYSDNEYAIEYDDDNARNNNESDIHLTNDYTVDSDSIIRFNFNRDHDTGEQIDENVDSNDDYAIDYNSFVKIKHTYNNNSQQYDENDYPEEEYNLEYDDADENNDTLADKFVPPDFGNQTGPNIMFGIPKRLCDMFGCSRPSLPSEPQCEQGQKFDKRSKKCRKFG